MPFGARGPRARSAVGPHRISEGPHICIARPEQGLGFRGSLESEQGNLEKFPIGIMEKNMETIKMGYTRYILGL